MSRKFSDFEIRMKDYEHLFTSQKCMPQLPTFCRIDGKAFHTWTSDLKRPYDERLSRLFVDTTKFLLEETGARIGYTQSDEITLCFWFEDYKSQLFFDGKIHKLNSVIASLATGFFNENKESSKYDNLCHIIKKDYTARLGTAFFDCRTWQVPNLDEAANVFLWREQDATRNSIAMAAQSLYSHKELHEKNSKQMQEMLHEKGINWNDYPDFFKRGTYVIKDHELCNSCAKKISCNRDPDCSWEDCEDYMSNGQRRYKELKIPPLGKIENRVGVLFREETPIEKMPL